jgi:hypothetical protein
MEVENPLLGFVEDVLREPFPGQQAFRLLKRRSGLDQGCPRAVEGIADDAKLPRIEGASLAQSEDRHDITEELLRRISWKPTC